MEPQKSACTSFITRPRFMRGSAFCIYGQCNQYLTPDGGWLYDLWIVTQLERCQPDASAVHGGRSAVPRYGLWGIEFVLLHNRRYWSICRRRIERCARQLQPFVSIRFCYDGGVRAYLI